MYTPVVQAVGWGPAETAFLVGLAALFAAVLLMVLRGEGGRRRRREATV